MMCDSEGVNAGLYVDVCQIEKNECMVAARVKGRAYMLSMYVHVFVSLV